MYKYSVFDYDVSSEVLVAAVAIADDNDDEKEDDDDQDDDPFVYPSIFRLSNTSSLPQSIHPTKDQPTNRPTDRTINQLIYQSVKRSIIQLINLIFRCNYPFTIHAFAYCCTFVSGRIIQFQI